MTHSTWDEVGKMYPMSFSVSKKRTIVRHIVSWHSLENFYDRRSKFTFRRDEDRTTRVLQLTFNLWLVGLDFSNSHLRIHRKNIKISTLPCLFYIAKFAQISFPVLKRESSRGDFRRHFTGSLYLLNTISYDSFLSGSRHRGISTGVWLATLRTLYKLKLVNT